MGGSTSIQQGFPNLSTPFVNSSGFIQAAWSQLLINIWNRTGGGISGNGFVSGDLKESAIAGGQPGWLVCDGSAISRGQYADLFLAIGTTYGSGDGTTTFNIPNYLGKFRLGTNGTYPLGTSGGATTVALTSANNGPHDHTLNDPTHIHVPTDPQHLHEENTSSASGGIGPGIQEVVNGSGSLGTNLVTSLASTGITINAASTGITMDSSGSGTPFSILPPYSPSTILIKT